MTPKQKAEYLLNKMLSKNPNIQDGISMIDTIQAKLCAIVAVDEIINVCPFIKIDFAISEGAKESDAREYWQEVKQEIEKL
jgi:hypothetical protein